MLETLREEVVRYARKMHASGLVQATQGNLSARDADTGLICITPSASDYDLLTPADIAVVTERGEIVEGTRAPSLELPLHTLVYQQRADVRSVMHTHSPYATAFGVVYEPIRMVLMESALCLGPEVPIAPYQMSGTPEFAAMAVAHLGSAQAMIWGNHGAMVVGGSLAQTYSIAHALEDSARVYAIARQLGTPVVLPDDEVERLHAFWLANYHPTALAPVV